MPSDRTTGRQHRQRVTHALADALEVLRAGRIAHVGFLHEGQPMVIPMAYVVDDEAIYLHGSNGSRLMRAMAGGVSLCITVTLLDALVLAATGFDHSMNYRSVVALGKGQSVEDPDDKRRILAALVDFMVPGRACELPPSTDSEIAATMIVRIALDEYSVKQRSGPAYAQAPDPPLDRWVGVVPLETAPGPPCADPPAQELETPPSVERMMRHQPTAPQLRRT